MSYKHNQQPIGESYGESLWESSDIHPIIRVHYTILKSNVTVDKESLSKLFRCFGEVDNCTIDNIKICQVSGLITGTADISFKTTSIVFAAATALNNVTIALVHYRCTATYKEMEVEVDTDDLDDMAFAYDSPCAASIQSSDFDYFTESDVDDEEYPESLLI